MDAEPPKALSTLFRITIARQPDGWHIDYELTDAMRDGGGPHYVIAARSGKILAKRYEP